MGADASYDLHVNLVRLLELVGDLDDNLHKIATIGLIHVNFYEETFDAS